MATISISLEHKHVIVVGLGTSGRAAARFLLKRGAHVKAYDDNLNALEELPEIVSLKEAGMELLKKGDIPAHADLVVVSPGIPAVHPLLILAHQRNWEVIGEIELACRHITQRVVGITGTNGKTTVTLLIEHVLNLVGLSAQALGNSGVPLTEVLCNPLKQGDDEIYVVELSSYQLETLYQKCLDVALILNITPDHLDRYPSMKEYADAKIKIGHCLKEGGQFYVEEKCARDFGVNQARTYGYGNDCWVRTDFYHVYEEGEAVFSVPASLKGKPSHNLENLMAAFVACQAFGVTGHQFIQAFETFKKPSHRIEFVRTVNGVHYVDDSKGTNLDAVIRAVEGIDGEIVLIAGGVDKGAAYTPWISAFKGKVCRICAIGQAAQKIELELGNQIPTSIYSSLAEAVNAASSKAKPGQTVLLSPGCSSFDMFKDYAHRGDEFKRLVLAL